MTKTNSHDGKGESRISGDGTIVSYLPVGKESGVIVLFLPTVQCVIKQAGWFTECHAMRRNQQRIDTDRCKDHFNGER